MNQGTKKLLTTVGMSSTVLLAGLALNGQTSKAATQVSDNQVRVEAGDTYNSIAEANNVSIAELEQANGREVGGFDLIFPNEIITLPSASAVSNNSNTNDTNANTDTNTETNTNAVQAQETSSNEVSEQPDTNTQVNNQTAQTSSYNGQVLSASAGRVASPAGGTESYYNLEMSQVVANANAQGISGSYWVRADGVKMLGDYVMVAANRNVHPQGSIVQTTLGTGVVVDSGTFSISSPQDLDIAVNW